MSASADDCDSQLWLGKCTIIPTILIIIIVAHWDLEKNIISV